MSTNGGFNLGGINSTGQINEGVFALIDNDTPQEVRTKVSPVDGRTMQLVFSDEFEVEGRSFYPVSGPCGQSSLFEMAVAVADTSLFASLPAPIGG
jgi:hypothetical protein